MIGLSFALRGGVEQSGRCGFGSVCYRLSDRHVIDEPGIHDTAASDGLLLEDDRRRLLCEIDHIQRRVIAAAYPGAAVFRILEALPCIPKLQCRQGVVRIRRICHDAQSRCIRRGRATDGESIGREPAGQAERTGDLALHIIGTQSTSCVRCSCCLDSGQLAAGRHALIVNIQGFLLIADIVQLCPVRERRAGPICIGYIDSLFRRIIDDGVYRLRLGDGSHAFSAVMRGHEGDLIVGRSRDNTAARQCY